MNPVIICETPHPKAAEPTKIAGMPPTAPIPEDEASAPKPAETAPPTTAKPPFPTAFQFINPIGSTKLTGSFRQTIRLCPSGL